SEDEGRVEIDDRGLLRQRGRRRSGQQSDADPEGDDDRLPDEFHRVSFPVPLSAAARLGVGHVAAEGTGVLVVKVVRTRYEDEVSVRVEDPTANGLEDRAEAGNDEVED